jgi:hypothetical protein
MPLNQQFRIALAPLLLLLADCGGGGGASMPAPPSAPTISVQPTDQNVPLGQTATFSVTAVGSAPLSYQWNKNSLPIAGATASSYTTPDTQAGDNGSTFQVVVSNKVGSTPSVSAKLSVASGPPPAGIDVTTYKYDLNRSGLNPAESALTVANVASATFGLLRTLSVDGRVDAQPLYLSQLKLAGAAHNVVFAATEHDSVYAFDADSGAVLWHVSLLGAGESTSGSQGCGQITPEIGVTSTPVIDRSAGANGAIYLVAMSIDSKQAYHQRLHALDVTTGAELVGGPTEISASYPTSGGSNSFNPGQHAERAALLLSNGTIYTSFTSHCDGQPYSGWIIAFTQSSLAISGVLNVAANSSAGPAIWMSGGGPGADATGNIYLLTANGAFETSMDANGFPSLKDFGNSFLKISSASAGLNIQDYFAMSNEVTESNADQDLGSGGEMLLPDLTDSSNTVRHLVVGAGKDGNIYLVDRDSMGKFNANSNNNYQTLSNALPGGIWSTPAYFNGTVYYGDVSGTLKAFAISSAKLVAAPQSQTATQFTFPGTAPSVSANGTANGIVWAHENTSPAVLHAYDATNLAHEIYNSNQAAANRDHFGAGNKYITPVVADGKVLVGTTNSVAVFGLLP